MLVLVGLVAVASMGYKLIEARQLLREEKEKADALTEESVKVILDQGQQLSALTNQVANSEENESGYWKRRFEHLQKTIEGILRERDEWKEMYFGSVAQHQEGVAIIEQQLVLHRQTFVRLLRDHNELRKEHDLPLIQEPSQLRELESDPAGQVEKFYEKMRMFSRQAREMVERDRAFFESQHDRFRKETLRFAQLEPKRDEHG